MSILASELVTDVQDDFEGGNSLSVNWNSVLRRGMQNVIKNCRPATLKRRVQIYGGNAQDLNLYYCPTDVYVPGHLYFNEQLPIQNATRRFMTYVPPAHYYNRLDPNTYTIERVNGARFINVQHNRQRGKITVDNMNALGTKSGGSAALNQQNYLFGAGAIQATFNDSGVTLSDTLSSTIDISDYLRGIVVLPTYIPTADNLSKIEVRLLSSAGNYNSVVTTADNIEDYFVDGWNVIRFNLENRTTTGTPVNTAIASWEIIGTTTSGKTMTLIFDSFTIHKTYAFNLDYLSNAPFINSSGALWQTGVVYTTDSVNITEDEREVLHYEMCMLVVQSSTFEKVDSQASRRFSEQLQRAYDNYYAIYPSFEQPLSYNIASEISLRDDIDVANIQPLNTEIDD